ncbi:MAG TPA: hypothetical protein VFC63_20275 [Blastocatellia bacterium]|nr:hypothetical protein [Blastocatellia bacterium]
MSSIKKAKNDDDVRIEFVDEQKARRVLLQYFEETRGVDRVAEPVDFIRSAETVGEMISKAQTDFAHIHSERETELTNNFIKKWIVFFLTLVFVAALTIIMLYGAKKIDLPPRVLELVAIAMIGDVIGLVTFIAKCLFHR